MRAFGDFDPGESQSSTFTMQTDFSLSVWGNDLEFWIIPYIRAGVAKQATTVRTLTQLMVFTFTSQAPTTQTLATPTGYSFLAGAVVVAIVAIAVVVVAANTLARRRGVKKVATP